NPHVRRFSSGQQTWKLAKDQIPRFIITCVVVVFIEIVLKIFENQGNISRGHRHAFNTIMTLLELLLSLNFFEAFKDMAKALRWRFLTKGSFTIREMDLVLGGESLQNLARLMLVSWWKPLILFTCAAWILLNMLAQGSVGVMGLAYSMDKGYASDHTYNRPGRVDMARLDCYHDLGGMCRLKSKARMAKAHSLGQTTLNQNIARAYPFRTNRIIKASTGRCYQYNFSKDNNEGPQVFYISNGTYNSILTIPRPYLDQDSTTFIYNGTKMPQNADRMACGPRCLWMYALRQRGEEGKGVIYGCPITIGQVLKASHDYHHVLNDVARLAAASVALSGRPANLNGKVKNWQQYQLYPWGSDWEVRNLSMQEVGGRMAQHAIGSIANMAYFNPKQQQDGTLPTIGYRLKVLWRYIIPLTTLIVVAHASIVVLMLYLARNVVVVDDSHLTIARLLHGLVGSLDGNGSLLDGP
ncbi:MAG: hypothetical protein Q9167_008012, partial [Letrouitia subvulpina]